MINLRNIKLDNSPSNYLPSPGLVNALEALAGSLVAVSVIAGIKWKKKVMVKPTTSI